jgi:hypothetical protein
LRGYARLSDYAVERLGVSARWLRSFARVGCAFHKLPWLEGALASGTLGWTKVRLLAGLPPYARERLDMDPTRARALVRLERAAMASEPFARAYRSGALSWVKAGLLVPLISVDPLGQFTEEWIAWARQVTVRRLREDVEWALTLGDTDRAEFRRTGGLPEDREIGAVPKYPREDTPPGAAREIGAAKTCTVRMIAPAEVVRLLRAVLCTVRRRMEASEGRLPTEGQCEGRAPDGLTWQMGIRPGAAPLATYTSGDRRVDEPRL